MLGLIRKLLKNTKLMKTRYLIFLYRYDQSRYIKYSSKYKDDSEKIAIELRVLIHTIEKALSLPEKNKNFGHEKILNIIKLYEEYKDIPNATDKQVIKLSEDILQSYIKYCYDNNDDVSFIPQKYLFLNDNVRTAGTITMSNEKMKYFDFKNYAENRHSSRHYTESSIDSCLIYDIVKLAQSAPSACNRQSIKVHAVVDNKKINRILQVHGGIRGFSIPSVIFVISSDLGAYLNEGERSTCYVDGGIFVMNMLYSIEYYGLKSCPIIWNSEPENNRVMYKEIGVPENNEIVALITAGHPPIGEYQVPMSKRRNTQEILEIL